MLCACLLNFLCICCHCLLEYLLHLGLGLSRRHPVKVRFRDIGEVQEDLLLSDLGNSRGTLK